MNEALLKSLHQNEAGYLLRFFQRRLDSRDAAADATQETFLRLLEASHATLIENPQAYLRQVAKSVVRLSLLKRTRERAFLVPEILGAGQADEAPLADRIIAARQSLLRMARAIEELPKRCQQVFILSRLRGLPNGEIAALLGISRNMVEKHIIRALLHCRKVRAECLA